MNKFNLELDTHQGQALRIAVCNRLRECDIDMVNGIPRAVGSLEKIGKWYAPHSHCDELVRLHARLTRMLTGHKQYNAEIPFANRRVRA